MSNNSATVIIPDEIRDKETCVCINVNMAEVMLAYQEAIQKSFNAGLAYGKEVRRDMLQASPGNQDAVSDNENLFHRGKYIGIADLYSYGAYNSANAFEKARKFYHDQSTEIEHFSTMEEALQWAYNTCCNKNPGKNIPFTKKTNWRIQPNKIS